jgi:hypothetical protein
MVRQGEILEDHFHILRILLEHLLEERSDPHKDWSLKIAEQGNDHQGRRPPLKGDISRFGF